MKKVVLFITLVSAVVLVSTCAKRKEGHCRLKNQQVDITKPIIYFTCQFQSKLSEKPAQLRDMPEKISKRINYFLAEIAGGEIPLIIEQRDKSKLYLDTDADGSLSDERAFISKAVKRRLFGRVDHYRFGPITLEFEQTNGKFIKRIYIISRDKEMRYITLYPADYRKGKVLLGDTIYEVGVRDGNFDEKYDKIFSPPTEVLWNPGCDSFSIDLNRNGRLDFNYYQRSELMPLGKMVKVGSSYYSINIDESGDSLELNEVQPDLGTLELGNEKIKLKLWSDTAQQYFSSIKNNVKIPIGIYQAVFIESSHLDSEKNAWDFTCWGDTGALRDFEITKNKTTSYKIGPPFQIKTTAQKIREKVSIGFKLVGQAGEQYRPDFKRNGRRVSEPIFRIFDETGNVIDSGRFKYG